VTGQAREQLLAQLSASLPGQLRDQQLRALQAELSGSCDQLRDSERASYAGLGRRIEELLRLAEEQASSLIEAARAEAAKIASSAGNEGGES
jgi:cell division septum initiation protein DivIVA